MKTKNVLLVILFVLSLLLPYNSFSKSSKVLNSNTQEVQKFSNYEVWVYENDQWWIYVYSDSGVIIRVYQPTND
jgi:hypothetical protein